MWLGSPQLNSCLQVLRERLGPYGLRPAQKNIMEKTIFYTYSKDEQFVRAEKRITLKEYFELGKEFTPGTFISLVSPKDTLGGHGEHESFYIGDCTPYMQPTTNDGGVGWNLEDPRFDMYVNEVFLPTYTSRPRNYGKS